MVGGLRQINTLPHSPFTGQSFRCWHLLLLSISLIFLRYCPFDNFMVLELPSLWFLHSIQLFEKDMICFPFNNFIVLGSCPLIFRCTESHCPFIWTNVLGYVRKRLIPVVCLGGEPQGCSQCGEELLRTLQHRHHRVKIHPFGIAGVKPQLW